MTDAESGRSTSSGVKIVLIIIILLLLAGLFGIAYVLNSVQKAPQRVPVTANPPGVKVMWEAFTAGSFGKLQHPMAVAYDGGNRIYVTEPGNNAVLVFDKNGKNGRSFVTTGTINPTGVDVAADGTVYVTDPGLAKVDVFNPSGSIVRQFNFPGAVAVKVVGSKLYLLTKGTLFITDLQGTLLGQWGTYGRGINQLSNPRAVDVDSSGRIYIADLDNYRVVALSSQLVFLWQHGHAATTDQELNTRELGGPSGIALGPDGNLYVVDGVQSDIVVFNKAGKSVSPALSQEGDADDQLYLPTTIDSLGDNVFVVADTFHDRIVGFKLTPQPLKPGK